MIKKILSPNTSGLRNQIDMANRQAPEFRTFAYYFRLLNSFRLKTEKLLHGIKCGVGSCCTGCGWSGDLKRKLRISLSICKTHQFSLDSSKHFFKQAPIRHPSHKQSNELWITCEWSSDTAYRQPRTSSLQRHISEAYDEQHFMNFAQFWFQSQMEKRTIYLP